MYIISRKNLPVNISNKLVKSTRATLALKQFNINIYKAQYKLKLMNLAP